MATKPRLFLSHSTQEGSPERKILQDLAAALKQKYAILLDRETLVVGEDWRSTINVWIGTCDAVVILITPELINSEFCQYEWSILSYRRKFQPKFRIIPIYHNATPGQIAGKPHQISEITGYIEYESIEKLRQTVAAKLLGMTVEARPSEAQALYVAKLLQDAVGREAALDRAAAKIKLELGTWDPLVDKWLDFAVKIMGVGLERARPALRELKGYFENYQTQFEDLVTLVGCSWVDIGSSRRLQERATANNPRQGPLGLNAEQIDTARCYVLSASGRPPRENWPVGVPAGVFGTNYDDLPKQIELALREALNVDAEDDLDKLKKVLKIFRQDGDAVFIVLRAEWLCSKRLQDLCDAELFAWVNFLVLTGASPVDPALLPDHAMLTPTLPNGFERGIWDVYESSKETLGFKKSFEPKDVERHDDAGLQVGDQRGGALYVYSPSVKLAVNVALATGRPLLVRGAPGWGKSSLAGAVAKHLGAQYLEKVISSRTQSRDLMSEVDLIRRLNDAQNRKLKADWRHYIRPGVLWKAFDPVGAKSQQKFFETGKTDTDQIEDSGRSGPVTSAVVLLDEMDKADPDVPNNLLVALGSLQFDVEEIGSLTVKANPQAVPLIIVTSNDERDLPRAFLRRCVEIELPALDGPNPDQQRKELLIKIGAEHLKGRLDNSFVTKVADIIVDEAKQAGLDEAASLPSPAEFIDTLRAVDKLLGTSAKQDDILAIVKIAARKPRLAGSV